MSAPNDFPIFQMIYPELKFWLSIGGGFFGIFKGVEWIKGIKTNDLPHIQAGVDDLKNEMTKGFEMQTEAIVGALRESRDELRTYFAPRSADLPGTPRRRSSDRKRKTRR